jgi:diguanylate cyclase (GGDEF)-like protein/PAS domain S-box-containing protein
MKFDAINASVRIVPNLSSTLSHLSLGTKVLLAPAVGLACLIAVAAASYYGLTQQQYTMERIRDLRFAHLQLAMEANTFLQEAQFGVNRLLSSRPGIKTPMFIKATGDELRSKIQAAMPSLELLSKQATADPSEKQAIDMTIDAAHKYAKAVDEVLIDITRSNGQPHQTLKIDSAYELLSWRLTTLVSIERKLTSEAFAQSALHAKQLMLALAALLALSFLAALLVTLVVTRHIRGTIAAIRIAASELARGNLTCRATVPSDDEIGQTARAFNFLVDEVAKKVDQLQVANQQLNGEVEERKSVEKTLRESEERYRQLIEISPDAIMIEHDGKIVFANRSALKLFGALSERELLGRSMLGLVSQEWHRLVKEQTERLFEGKSELRPIEGKMARLDGTKIDVEITRSLFEYSGEKAIQIIVHDITKHKHYEEQLRKQALYDTLTGLPNRTYFMDQLERAIARGERTERAIFVLFIDIDRFKTINDSLGHDVGDELLQTMAERMLGCIRRNDVLARLGGDEFVLLLDDAVSEPVLDKVVGRILSTVARPSTLKNQEISVTCSIGCSVYPEDGKDAITLLKHADTAMYRAKAEGRNNMQRYASDMYIRVNQQLTMESRLRHALEREELLLHYQPQVNLQSGEIVAIEALLRWQHPELGLIAPAQFIPIAEETGLIVPIGGWVIRTACRQVRLWQEAGLPALRVAVNLSAPQLLRPALVIAELENALKASCLSAQYLELELTESASMNNPKRMVDILERFRQIGVSLAIDDFGTGYSNLVYLKQFPIQKLKIDRSFIHQMKRNTADLAIVQGIISIARGLQLEVVAEGVEEQEQLSLLIASGCDAMQGYHFSRPLPPEKCAALIRQHKDRAYLRSLSAT